MHESPILSWHEETIARIAAELVTDPERGLGKEEAARRLKKHGKNELPKPRRKGFFERLGAELASPLSFILLLAGIATTVLAHFVDATVIFIALVINIAISLHQEGRADRAFERLRESAVRRATVIREGKRMVIPADEVVVGDLIVLAQGVQVPADARIVFAQNLEANESALTGEWAASTKDIQPIATDVPPAEQRNMLFMGTSIVGGEGRGVVVATGAGTELGALAASLGDDVGIKTPLQIEVARVARVLALVVLVVIVAIFALGVSRGEDLSELFLVAIAVAVAAIPEGLPAAVTVVLAIGMEAILRRGGLVRNLLAAETLGSTTVILTDKTGTLTKADMRVGRVVTLESLITEERGEQVADRRTHEAHGDEWDALTFAVLASDAFVEHRDGGNVEVHGRPVERAIVHAALEVGIDQSELILRYPRADFLPFESRYRASISLNIIQGIKMRRAFVTGAPEEILDRAGEAYLDGRSRPMTDEDRARFAGVLKHAASQGMRVIGVGYRDTSMDTLLGGAGDVRERTLDGMTIVGFLLLRDPLREEVPDAIRTAIRAGARVIMATGDNPETAKAIARECGIFRDGDRVILGREMEKMSDHDLAEALRHASVLARMLPEQKLRVARVLGKRGEVVAMTGDGVNDAPALRAASIGVALGSGTEVAKEASDIVLQTDSFSVIVAAIEEGRRIVDNLKKILGYLLATSLAETIAIMGALALLTPVPLLPAQILWTNMLTEGFMNFAFAFEPKEEGTMMRRPKAGKRLFSPKVAGFVAIVGTMLGLVLLGLFSVLTAWLDAPIEEARTVLFAALTVTSIGIAFSLKNLRAPIWRTPILTNPYLIGSFAFGMGGLLIALNWAPLRTLLSLEEGAVGTHWVALTVTIVLAIFAAEGVKWLLFERRPRP